LPVALRADTHVEACPLHSRPQVHPDKRQGCILISTVSLRRFR
jgi:hypothetical protein